PGRSPDKDGKASHIPAPPLRRQGKCSCGGGCPDCSRATSPQGRLRVSQAGEPGERDAYHIAESLTAAHPTSISRSDEDGGRGALAPRAPSQPRVTKRNPELGDASPKVSGVLNSPGQPLDEPIRHIMEARLGEDLGDVRVHTNG